MFFSNPIQSLSDPIWCKGDPTFAQNIEYPFPEILRSPEECVEAMDWIVEKVVGLYDSPSVGVNKWYDFMWTKTWAIRKRIIQLHVDDLNGVGILERCARFHIFCAHAFAEIPEPLFVAQFNFEHIGKCLINLKYLYHDLNSRGIYCANETEFLCYYLLHFSKSYRDMIDFPREVRRSTNIQFALKFLEVENTNNFIGFFKLVKQATYLQGCLLHRYFKPMRERALRTMCKAYNLAPALIVKISVNEFNLLLDFEDDDERDNYLQCAGIEYDHTNVMFTKSRIETKVFKPEIRSSHKVIERLRGYRDVKEIVTGGEGLMAPIELERLFPRPKINYKEKGETSIVKVEQKLRVAEAIWKSLMFDTINNIVSEIFVKFRYPHGEPEHDYDDQPSIGSIVSELDGTRNESNAEISFDGDVEKKASQEQVEKFQHKNEKIKLKERVKVSTSISQNERELELDHELGLGAEKELIHESTSASTPTLEPEPGPDSTTLPSSSILETGSKKEPEPVMVKVPELKPTTFSASQLYKARISGSRFMRMKREKEKREAEQATQMEAQLNIQPELMPELATGQESKDETEIPQDGARADQGLDDSELVISGDHEDEPITSQNINSNVLASLIRAVAKYNNEHGVGSLNQWK